MADTSTAVQAKVQELVNESFASVKRDTERSISDLRTEIANRSADVAKLDAEVAKLKAAEIVGGRNVNDGPESEIRRTFGRDEDLLLLPTRRTYTIGRQTYTESVNGLLTSQKTYGEAHAEIKDLWDAIMIRLALKGVSFERASGGEILRAVQEHAGDFLARIGDRLKRMGLASDPAKLIEKTFGVASGSGADFIPSEVMSPELVRIASAAIMDSPLNLFVQKTLSARNNKNPLLSGRPRPYIQGEAVDGDAAAFLRTSMATGTFEYNVRNLAAAIQYDRNADADSILEYLPLLRMTQAEAMPLALFDAVLNGDRAATHQDSLGAWSPEGVFGLTASTGGSGVGGSLDHRRLFYGLRYRALTIGTRAKLDLSSSFTLAKFQQMRGKFSGGVGLNNERVALFASFSDILQHISTDSSVITVEKYGPLATVATGEIAKIGGVRVIRAWPLGRTGAETGSFHTDGLHSATPGNNTKSAIVLADLDRFHFGRRQDMRIETDTNILNGTGAVVATGRFAFESPDHGNSVTSSSTVNVVYGYNL